MHLSHGFVVLYVFENQVFTLMHYRDRGTPSVHCLHALPPKCAVIFCTFCANNFFHFKRLFSNESFHCCDASFDGIKALVDAGKQSQVS